jgi:hypothetical protein
MTLNQVNGVIRAVLPAVLAYAVGKGWINNEQVGDVTAAVATLAAAIWSIVTNIEGGKT